MKPSSLSRLMATLLLALPLVAQATFLSVDSTSFSIGAVDAKQRIGASWEYDPSSGQQSGSASLNEDNSEYQYNGTYEGGWSLASSGTGYQLQVAGSGGFGATVKSITPPPNSLPKDGPYWNYLSITEQMLFSQVITLNELTNLEITGLTGSDPANGVFNSFEVMQQLPCDSSCGSESVVTVLSLGGNVSSTTTQLAAGTYFFNFSVNSGNHYLQTSTRASSDYQSWIIDDPMSASGSLAATLTANLSPVSAVPVPAAAWLFGSALLGLIGRRKLGK